MPEKFRILIVEDDLNILLGLEDNLAGEGYLVETASNGTTGLQKAQEGGFHLLLLDVMLPGLNGFEICRRIKSEQPALPVIILTARGSEIDKVAGLDYGADDYVTKPFGLSELLARIRAVLRRAYPSSQDLEMYAFDDVQIDFQKMKAVVRGNEVRFTTKEYAILKYLIQHEGDPVSRHELLENVWGYDYVPTTRTVDNFILDIRKKIEKDPSAPRYIVSVSGVGYRFQLPQD